MESLRKHLEIAFADAIYEEQYVVADLIAVALDAILTPREATVAEADAELFSGNVVAFPGTAEETS